jgi:hypothetical protein
MTMQFYRRRKKIMHAHLNIYLHAVPNINLVNVNYVYKGIIRARQALKKIQFVLSFNF